ncbi:hypothetical protein LOTGIDRAFT_158537 [Lottia gigantea]|uniref:EMI domain-containing protein n=1 Tax=Lottia gigantea TaxID=225164 RepID=V4A6C6_LOTGI|nr:hypothetical protein LOTGIDRAFT_158537 [Lottia gigantea]ESO99453.1 hypothetical protein LOTGIDRAFT_158537 [Lottia gigantea]
MSNVRPNVCPYQDVAMVLMKQPCVQAFTRLVKVWKPNCGYTHNWCVGYERRTHYYTTYKERYQPQQQTRYKCCNGWRQLGQESGGCMYKAFQVLLCCCYIYCSVGGSTEIKFRNCVIGWMDQRLFLKVADFSPRLFITIAAGLTGII